MSDTLRRELEQQFSKRLPLAPDTCFSLANDAVALFNKYANQRAIEELGKVSASLVAPHAEEWDERAIEIVESRIKWLQEDGEAQR